VRAWLAALLLLGTLGCGPGAASEEPAVVRLIMADDWASAPVVREVIDAFEREHEARVQVQAAPFSQIPDLVASAQQLEQPFDIAHWHAFAAAAAGLAEDLEDAWEAAGLTDEEFLPGAVEDVVWRGRRYGIPLDTNALVLLAHTDALEAVEDDLDDLRTGEGFVATSRRLVEAGAVEHAITVTTSSWSAYGWIRALGGELVAVDERNGRPEFSFDAPATVAAVELLVGLVEEDLAPPVFGMDTGAHAVQAFVDRQVAFSATGSWDLRLADANGHGHVAVVPLPQADPSRPHTVLGGSSLFVPVGAGQPELAVELMLALTEDDVALQLAAEEGRLPARPRVFEAPLFQDDPALAAFVAQLPHARVMPLIAFPEVAAAFQEAYEDALAQRATPREAMERVQRFAERWAEGR